MAHLEREILIAQPPERVFAYLAQPERTPEWSPNVVSVRLTSDGPIGVGATTESVVKALGTTQRAVGRCTVFDPPRRLVIESRTNLGATTVNETVLIAEGVGTRLRAKLDYTLPGGALGGGLLGGFLGVDKQIQRDFEQSLVRLGAVLGAGADAR
ncbi:MAG: SRPBCC family protein [Chloroflexota bacterium]|nr:SRPBCC family protein [Chloroflexota bacterium]